MVNFSQCSNIKLIPSNGQNISLWFCPCPCPCPCPRFCPLILPLPSAPLPFALCCLTSSFILNFVLWSKKVCSGAPQFLQIKSEKKMFAKSNQVIKLKTGFGKKKFLDVTLVGEDDLDFLLHGMTLVGGWNTVVLLGLVKIQHQCSTMTWIQIRQIFTNFLLLVLCVVLSMHRLRIIG